MLKHQTIPLKLLDREKTQARAKTHPPIVTMYAEAMKKGAKFPRAVVFQDPDGRIWVGDGHHRYLARIEAGFTDIDVEVRPGTWRDAVLWNMEANKKHSAIQWGPGDKKRAVEILLKDAEWGNLNAREIAAITGASRSRVSQVRVALEQSGVLEYSSTVKRVLGDGNTTKQIRRRAPAPGLSPERRARVMKVKDAMKKGMTAKEISSDLGICIETAQDDMKMSKNELARSCCPRCGGRGFVYVDKDGNEQADAS